MTTSKKGASQIELKAVIDYFFDKVGPETYMCKSEKRQGRGKPYKQKAHSGFSNLFNHLKACVCPTYEDVYRKLLTESGATLDNFAFINSKEQTRFKWIE